MFSAKQGTYWYHFYNLFGMTRSLTGVFNSRPPALEASTIPLGHRGGGVESSINNSAFVQQLLACVVSTNTSGNCKSVVDRYKLIVHIPPKDFYLTTLSKITIELKCE